MEEIRVTAFEISYTLGNIGYLTDFSKGNMRISEDGRISTTFQRDIEYSDDYGYGYNYDLPIVETYEYKISPWEIQRLFFNRYDLLSLKPGEDDVLGEDKGQWKITIYTKNARVDLSGFNYPQPYGEALFDGLKRLLKYKVVPDLP